MSQHSVREIETLLIKINEESKGDPDVAKDAVVDLAEIFSASISSDDIGLCINLLFSKGGLTEFCRNVANNSKFVDAKKCSFDLLKFLLEKDSSLFSKYANDLERLCRHLYNADTSSKVRCGALDTFCLLLNNNIHNLDFEDLDFKRLIEQLCFDVHKNKGSMIVYHQLCTLGALAKAAPEKTEDQSNLIFRVLKDQLIKKTGRQPDFGAAAGALRGLTSYLRYFPQGLDDSEAFYAQIYPHVHKLLNPELNLPRRDVQRAALELIHEHGSKFGEEVLKRHETLFRWLSRWCQSPNRDDHKVALKAMDTFVVVVANSIELRAEEDRAICLQVFKFLLKEFNEMLERSKSSSHISLAVKGYGLLAGPCRIFLSSDDVFKMFSRVLAVSQQGFFQSAEMLETKVANLPSYIESLGIIVSKLDCLSSGMVDSVLQLSLALVENFPHVSQFTVFLTYRALLTLIASMREKANVYSSFVNSFVYHSILHTCSHIPVVDKEAAEGSGSFISNSAAGDRSKWSSSFGLKGEPESYKNYLPLWKTFLAPEKVASVKVTGCPASVLTEVSHHLYEEFLDCVLEVVEKLDLSTYRQEEPKEAVEEDEEASSDPVKGLKAKTPKDFQIYINLCCLMEEVIPLQKDVSLKPHLPRLFLYFVRRSSSEPLVSTHYSVLTLFLLSANDIEYFLSMDTTSPELETTLHLLTSYVSKVLQRCKQYRDHLLASCLTLLLRIPMCIVQKLLPELVSPLQMCLEMGLSYLPIARICISALHFWSSHLTKDQLKVFLPEIIPLLLPYLRSKESLSEAELQTRVITVKMALAKQRRKVDKRKIRDMKKIDNSEMRKVQLSILQLLGHLDQDLCFTMVTNQKKSLADLTTAWDTQKHILFSVPFLDVKLDIFLDDILPETVDKALNSSDRQTKVAACELLHSIVILMIGTGHQQSEQTQRKHPMTSLYLRVFGAMLSLSCDADNVTRQLFLTLTFQTIHWFTNNRTFEHPDTAVLLQVILDSLVTPNDPSLRDLSAQCLLEFLKWSRKQSKDKKQSQINLKSILKRIMALCQHPSAYKRLGGCLAWNSIYKEVREDETSCNEWIVHLLSTLMICLRSCQDDDPLHGTQAQCQMGIDHVERILRVRKELFNKVSSTRRLPVHMERGDSCELLEWLLERIDSTSELVRHSSMNLILALAPHTKGYSSGQDFLTQQIKRKGSDYLLNLLERSLPQSITDDEETHIKELTLKDMMLRMKNLLASLDCYVWIISKDVFKTKDLLSRSDLKIFREVRYFVLAYAMRNLLPSFTTSTQPTLSQMEKFNTVRCTAVVRVLDFVCVLAQRRLNLDIFDDQLQRLLLACVFNPPSVGFNVKDANVTDHLPQRMTEILSGLLGKLPSSVDERFRQEINELIRKEMCGFFAKLPATMDAKSSVPTDLSFALDGMEVLHRSGWLKQDISAPLLLEGLYDWLETVLFGTEMGVSSSKELNAKHLPFIKKCLRLSLQLNPKERERVLTFMTSSATFRGSDGRQVKKGAHVSATLGDVLDLVVLEDPSLCVSHAVSMATNGEHLEAVEFLSRLFKVLVKNAQKRKSHSAKLIECFLSQWETLNAYSSQSDVTKGALLSLLMTAIMADKDGVIRERLKEGDASGLALLTLFKSFLCDPQLDLPTKARTLKLLPFFLTDRDAESVVKETLQNFRLQHLPLRFSEYQVGSLRERELRSVVLELLLALELTSSLHMLEFVVRLFCCEDDHPYVNDLQKSLRHVMTASQTTKQIDILNFLFNFFRENANQALRVGMLESVLVPCLHLASEPATLHFFLGCVSELVPPLNTPVRSRSGDEMKILVTKYGAFSLLQVLYSKLPRGKLFSPGAEVNAAFDAKDTSGKELTKEVLRRSVKTAKGELRIDSTHQELRRKVSCAAYNALIAVLSNVQDQLKFYNNLLFSEASSSEAIFEGIIDSQKTFHFDMEVNFDPGSKNRFVAVHRSQGGGGGATPMNTGGGTVQYMASHYLSDSSLREDVSQFDFSCSVVVSEAAGLSIRKSRENESGGMTVMRLDRSDFNDHEVMPNLTAIIRHMVTNGISTLYSQATPPSVADLPQWMTFLKAKLEDRSTGTNVKLFLLRLIMNTEEVFAPYAGLFVLPILATLVDGIVGNDVNYFVADLLVTLLSWGERGIPQDKTVAGQTFKFVVAHTPHLRADVFKYNLNLVKTIVEKWKNVLTVPHETLASFLGMKDGAKREVEAGLQVSGILLANGLAPFCEQDLPAAQSRFLSQMCALMSGRAASVYSAAAEVIGLLLKYLEGRGEPVEDILEQVVITIKAMLTSDQGQGLSCIYFIQKHFPKVVGRLINKLLSALPRLYGIHRERILQCLVSHAPDMDDIFSHLKEQNILENLMRKEAKTQLVSLELVNVVLHRLEPKQIEYLLPGIACIEFHSAPSCRELMYESFIWIYNNFDGSEGGTECQLAKEAQTVLLKGTQDEDAALRQSVRNFWIQKAKELSLIERLTFVLKKLYTSETENSFLLLATHILLEASHSTPDFLRPIFRHPLTECNFREMKISPGWKAQHASMIPLFADSQSSFDGSTFESLISMTQTEASTDGPGLSNPGPRAVQATQNLVFSATQNPAGQSAFGDTYNWVTGASLDPTIADKEFTASHAPGASSVSGLFFSEGRDMKQFKRQTLGNTLLRPDEPDSKKKESAKKSMETQLLRRRFVANQDREKQTTFFARQEELRSKMRKQIEMERKMKREAQVTIYRQYRVGELPDVQIPHKALIAPLQALAEKDESLASRLFQLVAEGVIRESSTMLSPGNEEEWKEDVKGALTTILSSSETCNPHVMRALLHLVLVCDFDVNPEHVSSVCLRSSLEPLGILCLERQHLRQRQKVKEPARKRQRVEHSIERSGEDTTLWLNIADLYKSVCMWDAVLGVLKSEIGALKEETVKALEAETEKNHFEAYKNYITALHKEDWIVEPSAQERQVWEEWFVSSSENLGQWEEIEKFVEDRFLEGSTQQEKLSRVWDLPRQPFSLVLPSLVKSKLMKILHGSEDDGGLCGFVDASRSNSRQRFVLENEVGLPLAVLAVNQEKMEEARSLLRSAQVSLLSQLVQCSLLATKSMVDHLKGVQALSELDDFVHLIMKNTAAEDEAATMVKLWGSHKADSNDCPVQSQFMTSYRNLYLHLLKRSFNLEDRFVNTTKAASHISVIQSALADSNPHLAHRHLAKLEKIPKDDLLNCQFYFLKTQTSVVRTDLKEPREMLPYLVEAWCKYLSKVNDCIKESTTTLELVEAQYLLLEGSICLKICDSIRDLGREWNPETKYMKVLSKKFPDVNPIDSGAWFKGLLECSHKGLSKATSLLLKSEKGSSMNSLHDPYSSVFTFYEDCLESWRNEIDVPEFTRSFLTSVLKGMTAGSRDAHFRFPRLICLLEENCSPDLVRIFQVESKRVPLWMFLLWLSHILIYFDKTPGHALHPIMKKLTKAYPQAVIYPFELSKESFDFTKENGAAAERVCEEMKNELDRQSLVRQFITAISLVHLPHIEMKDELDKAARISDEKKVRQCVKEIYKNFLTPLRQRGSSCAEKGSAYYNLDNMMKTVKNIMEYHCGANLSKIDSLRLDKFHTMRGNMVEDVFQHVGGKVNSLPADLKSYSPWLAAFTASEHKEELEIPGQYHGMSQPMPEYHIKVSGFSPQLTFMRSLRVPVRITIVGSDEKEHPFLLKSGEDLRTDERVQGMFSLLNNIYATHASLRLSQKPSIVTYRVTPLTVNVGIMEWVNKTQQFKVFLDNALNASERKNYELANQNYFKNGSWKIEKSLMKKEECVRKYEAVVNLVPWDLMRRGLFQLASGYEGFFYLRNTFISSYATLSLSHWLIGIGDRHLSNFLLNMKTGHAVGIDFGHHFETATRFLPVPELIPFRLTNQIINVMQPLGIHGQFRETMIACLSALRNQRQVIFATAEAFIKEPTEDWKGFATRMQGKSLEVNLKKFSDDCMATFKAKLTGHNPAQIFVWALSENASVKKYKNTKELQDIAAGKGQSQRNKADKSSSHTILSVTDQVDFLIEQATDPNILGRTFVGWQPFI